MAPGHRVVVNEFGESPLEALERHLQIEEQPWPDTAALAADDVVVAIKSAAVGWVDLLMMSGQYQHMASPPYCPGLEYTGVVAWCGADVRSFAIGDRVMSDGLLTGPRSLGKHQQWGGFASYAVAPANALIGLHESLSFAQGCGLLSSYETAYHCLVHRGRLQAGEKVLILGASGSTGLAAVHVAKQLGATVIATGRSREKLDVVAAEGADHVIQTARGEDGKLTPFRDEVKALAGGGVDVVYDGVGGDLSLESLRCVRFGARFLVVGWASTPFVAKGKGQRGAPRANVLPTNLIMMKGLDVLGCPAAISAHHDPSIRAARLVQVLDWVNSGGIRPHVSKTFPMAAVKEAMRAKWESQFVGAVTLDTNT